MSWRFITGGRGCASAFTPIMWTFLMKAIPKAKSAYFSDPESEPFGSGYHINSSHNRYWALVD